MKILDGEFRNALYKSLTEAGYDKKEAQKIICTKYYSCLHEDLKNTLDELLNNVVKENFEIAVDGEMINAKIAELNKLKGILEA